MDAIPRRLATVLTAFTIMVAATAPRAAEMPPFAKYPATASHSGAPAVPNFAGLNIPARHLPLITEAARKGPNFARAYTVVTFGCGTGCQSVLVIDARNGTVWTTPKPATHGVSYRKDSRLLVSNADPVHRLKAKWLVFNGKQFRQIR